MGVRYAYLTNVASGDSNSQSFDRGRQGTDTDKGHRFMNRHDKAWNEHYRVNKKYLDMANKLLSEKCANCPHVKSAHDPVTKDCFFQYNCDCKRFVYR